MGNPVRPALSHWLLGGAVVFDVIGGLGNGDPMFFRTSFGLLTAGIVACLLLSILWFRNRVAHDRARRWHDAANVGALLSFILSWALRYSFPGTPSDPALAASFGGVALALAARLFDGELQRRLRSLPLPVALTLVLLALAVGLEAVRKNAWFHRPPRDDSRLTLRGHRGVVSSVALSADGHRIASGGWDETVRVWDTNTGRGLHVLRGHTDRIMALAFSPDGHWLVSGSKDATARVWEVGTGRLAHVLSSHGNRVTALAFAADGSILVTGSRDRTVKIWDAASWRELKTLSGHSGFVWSVSFSPDGDTLASGSWDGTIRLWDVNGSAEPRVITTRGRVHSAVFSRDGPWLASNGDNEASVWNVEAGRQPRIDSTYRASAVFAIRGDLVYSADRDRAIRIRSLNGGTVPHTLLGHSDQLTSIAVSAVGDLLVSSSDDGTVKVWHVKP
jgi:WD40 repeat protein